VQSLRGRALLDPAVAQHTSFVRAPGFLSALEVALVLNTAWAHGEATGGMSGDGTTYLHHGRDEPHVEQGEVAEAVAEITELGGAPPGDLAVGSGGNGGSGGSGSSGSSGGDGNSGVPCCAMDCADDGTGSVPPALAGLFRRIRGHVAAVDAEHWGTLCEEDKGGLDLQLTAGGVGDDVHARCVEFHEYSATARRTCGTRYLHGNVVRAHLLEGGERRDGWQTRN
jgi:hypothetical protein